MDAGGEEATIKKLIQLSNDLDALDEIFELLDDVKLMAEKEHHESYLQGKEFNIFYIQGKASDEVRVCRLIRELLDPKGRHGQGAFFLRRFIEHVLKIDDPFSDDEYNKACVTREERIDAARRIDLVIRIGNRFLPLEVKIYADDQENQCVDYFRYAAGKDPNSKVYYLTLDGHKPTDAILGLLSDGEYVCLSFADEILPWLDGCVNAPELEQITPVREILEQFIRVIRDLTGRQEGNVMSEIISRIGSSSGNAYAAKQISDALTAVKTEKMRKVFRCITDYMKNRGFTDAREDYLERSDKYYRTSKSTWPYVSFVLHFPDKALDGKLAVCFQIGEQLYWGIRRSDDHGLDKEDAEMIADYVRHHLAPESAESWADNHEWYWWKYLHENNSTNFRLENDEYFRLFDEDGFDNYMKEAYAAIDSFITARL